MSSRPKQTSFIALLGPGLLLAATGVGGGDLATATFVGEMLGTAVLWAAVVAAFLKFVVTEGLTRWQLATGETILEGVALRLGPIVIWLFLPYFLLWSFFVGSAQMSANGVSLHALIPVFDDARDGKIVFGVLSSLFGLGLVLVGGYRAFEVAMKVCIGVMFVTVVVTAAMLWPGWGAVLTGLVVPRIPDVAGEPILWTVALIGGLGGTLTVLCYGYWLREDGRTSPDDLRACRIDLGASYTITALFGAAMMIVGSNVEIEGEGTALLVTLSDRLGAELGPAGKWLFLVGTFGTVFSSLLGVWQAAPYLFADCWRLLGVPRGAPVAVNTRAVPYRAFLVVLALVPMIGLFFSFREVQKFYTVIGAYVFPLLALALLVLNSREAWIGARFKNRPLTVIALVAVLAFFTWLAVANIQSS
jgi:Mn2+/Fe2+ NRAMP family transporter